MISQDGCHFEAGSNKPRERTAIVWEVQLDAKIFKWRDVSSRHQVFRKKAQRKRAADRRGKEQLNP